MRAAPKAAFGALLGRARQPAQQPAGPVNAGISSGAGYGNLPIQAGSTGDAGLDNLNMGLPAVGGGQFGQQYMFGKVMGQGGAMGMGMPPPTRRR